MLCKGQTRLVAWCSHDNSSHGATRAPDHRRRRRAARSSPSSPPLVLLWGGAVTGLDLGDPRRHVRRSSASASRSASTACFTHRSFEAPPPAARRARDPRLDVGAGRGHPLGRRPPQAPRLHRRGGRPAQPAHCTAATAGAACSPGSGTRTWAGCSTASAAPARRYAPDLRKDPLIRRIDSALPAVGRARPRDPVRRRLLISGGELSRGLTALAVGGPRAHLPPAPRDVERELDLPHVRQAAVRHRGREPQQLGRRARVDGRGLAPLPPRVPDVGAPRPPAATSSTRPT